MGLMRCFIAVASRAAAVQAAVAHINHEVLVEHTGAAVEDVVGDMRRQVDAAIAVERMRREGKLGMSAAEQAESELQVAARDA